MAGAIPLYYHIFDLSGEDIIADETEQGIIIQNAISKYVMGEYVKGTKFPFVLIDIHTSQVHVASRVDTFALKLDVINK